MRDFPQPDPRTPAQLGEHYDVERELADRLRNATRDERRFLYGAIYDELYRRVPHHPQLTRKPSAAHTRALVAAQLRLLQPFLRPHRTFLEIGAGDCVLSREVAKQVRQVYALEVTRAISDRGPLVGNLELLLSDGVRVPLPSNSVDVAYSNQVMEHVHPDDVLEQLAEVWRVLRRGGVYVCVTPNRLNGPHDISRYFSAVAKGFHLKEYTVAELAAAFRTVGFREVRPLISVHGTLVRCPVAPVRALELLLAHLPPTASRLLARTRPCGAVLGVRLVASK